MDCYHHPGTASTATCVACGQPICPACREDVAGHPMCRPCVAAAEARLTAPEAPAADAGAQEAEAPSPDLTAVAYEKSEPVPRCGFVEYLKAVLFAGIAAVVGAVIWDKFVLWTGFQLGLIAVVLGVLVAIAVRAGAAGRPGVLLPWIGAVMAGFAIFLGYALLIQDQIARQDPQSASRLASFPFVIRMPLLMYVAVRSLDLLDWVFVAIGVWEGWSIPRRMNQEAEAGATSSPAPGTSSSPQ